MKQAYVRGRSVSFTPANLREAARERSVSHSLDHEKRVLLYKARSVNKANSIPPIKVRETEDITNYWLNSNSTALNAIEHIYIAQLE